jgi:hypothetical protein
LARYGDQWTAEIKKTTIVAKLSDPMDMINHMVTESVKGLIGTTYEGHAPIIFHDALNQVKDIACQDKMKAAGIDHLFLKPVLGCNEGTLFQGVLFLFKFFIKL